MIKLVFCVLVTGAIAGLNAYCIVSYVPGPFGVLLVLPVSYLIGAGMARVTGPAS